MKTNLILSSENKLNGSTIIEPTWEVPSNISGGNLTVEQFNWSMNTSTDWVLIDHIPPLATDVGVITDAWFPRTDNLGYDETNPPTSVGSASDLTQYYTIGKTMEQIVPGYNEIKIQTVDNYSSYSPGYWVLSKDTRDFIANEPDDLTGVNFRTQTLLDAWDENLTLNYDTLDLGSGNSASGPLLATHDSGTNANRLYIYLENSASGTPGDEYSQANLLEYGMQIWIRKNIDKTTTTGNIVGPDHDSWFQVGHIHRSVTNDDTDYDYDDSSTQTPSWFAVDNEFAWTLNSGLDSNGEIQDENKWTKSVTNTLYEEWDQILIEAGEKTNNKNWYWILDRNTQIVKNSLDYNVGDKLVIPPTNLGTQKFSPIDIYDNNFETDLTPAWFLDGKRIFGLFTRTDDIDDTGQEFTPTLFLSNADNNMSTDIGSFSSSLYYEIGANWYGALFMLKGGDPNNNYRFDVNNPDRRFSGLIELNYYVRNSRNFPRYNLLYNASIYKNPTDYTALVDNKAKNFIMAMSIPKLNKTFSEGHNNGSYEPKFPLFGAKWENNGKIGFVLRNVDNSVPSKVDLPINYSIKCKICSCG